MSYGYPGQGYGGSGGGGGGYGYGGGYGGHQPPPGQHGYGGYAPPAGHAPPPRPRYYGDGYEAPPGPPRERSYGYHQAPPNPHPDHAYTRQYGAPNHPPPAGLDVYGYPNNRGSDGRPNMPTAHSNSWTHGNRNAPPPPPSGFQRFGHGAPDSYGFQYSNCTGKRKALLIGINYFGQDGELRGCLNDVKNISAFLSERYGYKKEDMVILTDDQENPVGQPTRNNILRAMHWLVQGAQPNDSLFFHFSGHGGYTEDEDGDEDDGMDEVIYPVDFKEAGHIVDDEMHAIMVKPLQPGVRLTAIFDSCHSGTALDLPYVYSTKGVLKEPNLAKEAGEGLLTAVTAYASGDMTRVLSSIMDFGKKALKGDKAHEYTKATRTSPADVIMWSGSKDDQTSADATIANRATGAMSHAFITSLRANPQQSYVQLLNSIRDILSEGDYSQLPQLSSSHPIDTDILFVM
ncbi:hypothetical protein ACRALDRAFT_1042633 [Sodiomyces alcalophilus JCM 7366]|uniref:uncharacterized protein n=1 Tax=Sodiomyces alcalophilus JCM 7366 TaxID=591952 RepID=UPI0039B5910D